MWWLRFAFLVITVTVLQAGFVDTFAITHLNITPDLLLILMVFFASCSSSSDVIIACFAIGFAADLIGPAMGPKTILFGLFGTLLANLTRVITIRRMLYQAIAIFFTSALVGTAAHLLCLVKGQPLPEDMEVVILGTAVYSAIAGPFLFLPSQWWMHIKTRRFR